MMRPTLWICAAIGVAAGGLQGQDPNQQLKNHLKDTAVGPGWIYNDLNAGFAEAKKSGKPILAVFR